MTSPSRPAVQWMRAHPGAAIEATVAVLLVLALLSLAPLRGVVGGTFRAIFVAARALPMLLREDTGGTFLELAWELALLAMLVGPPIRWALHVPPHRRAWLGLFVVFLGLALPGSLAAFSHVAFLLLALAAAALGLALAKRPYLRVLAFAPLLVCFAPFTGHGPGSDYAWPRARLETHCADRPGMTEREIDAVLSCRYYAATLARPDLALLTAERAAWWASVAPSGLLTIRAPSRAEGNLWTGCTLGDGELWLAHRGELLRVDPPPGPLASGAEHVEHIALTGPASLPVELDYAEAICDPARRQVYVSEVIRGGLWTYHADTRIAERRELGDINLQGVMRADGRLVLMDTGALFVFDPGSDEIVWRGGAGIAAMAIDMCASDGSIVVTDMAGRLRSFAVAGDGYVVRDAVAVPAARRVALSPDCSLAVVTSADDQHMFVLRTHPLTITDSHEVGPGLRDVTFIGPRTLVIADACIATTFVLSDDGIATPAGPSSGAP